MYLLEKLQSQIEVRVRFVSIRWNRSVIPGETGRLTCVKCSRFERKSIIYPFESDTIHLNTTDFDVSR